TAAAGLATLRHVAESDAIERANRTAALLRKRLNQVLSEAGSKWVVYGEHSGFHVFLSPHARDVTVEDIYAGRVAPEELKGGASADEISRLRCGLILGGADIFPWPGGCVSAVHNPHDVELTAHAVKQCVEIMRAEA